MENKRHIHDIITEENIKEELGIIKQILAECMRKLI